MSVMRVNCAHDGPEAWSAMIGHLRSAERKHGRVCRVSFDLAGPKLRTGPIASGPEVLRFKPVRDALGRVTAPATILLGPSAGTEDDDVTLVPLSAHLHREARPGDVLRLRDSRGRYRTLQVDTVGRHSLLCTTEQTVYLATGTKIELWRGDRRLESGAIGTLPALESAIPLEVGDALVVTRDLAPGQPAVLDPADEVIEPARIGCSLPAVFPVIRSGHRVLLDDGKFQGIGTRDGTRLVSSGDPASRPRPRQPQGRKRDQPAGHAARAPGPDRQGPGRPAVRRPARRSRRDVVRPRGL